MIPYPDISKATAQPRPQPSHRGWGTPAAWALSGAALDFDAVPLVPPVWVKPVLWSLTCYFERFSSSSSSATVSHRNSAARFRRKASVYWEAVKPMWEALNFSGRSVGKEICSFFCRTNSRCGDAVLRWRCFPWEHDVRGQTQSNENRKQHPRKLYRSAEAPRFVGEPILNAKSWILQPRLRNLKILNLQPRILNPTARYPFKGYFRLYRFLPFFPQGLCYRFMPQSFRPSRTGSVEEERPGLFGSIPFRVTSRGSFHAFQGFLY